MMSSFGPVVALDNLGSTLQNTFAAGNRVLDILDEQPVTKDITGCEEVEFNGAATENVTFSYGEETIISDVSIPVLKASIIGISGRSGSGKSTIAKLDATDEEIIEACKKASVHDFISKLPDGYDTNVGELGDMLSGGEKQRIALARSFLHDAPLILLDEPTSNLDSLNEGAVLKALDEEKEGKTMILVSHRESTMGIADQVYAVENGRMS